MAGTTHHGQRMAVLIGPPGSGKTTVGEALAAAWGTQLRDTDHDIERAAGKQIAEIFLDAGEAHFRQLERRAVLAALADLRAGGPARVVALGGGAPMDTEVQAALAGLPVVFLDVSLAAAAPRVGLSGARPLLAINPRATWQRLYAERREVYERLASLTISTDEASPPELAATITARLGAAGPVPGPGEPGGEPEPTDAAARPPGTSEPAGSVQHGAVHIEVGGASPYPVRIGFGARAGLAGALPGGVRRCLLITGPATAGAADDAAAQLAGLERLGRLQVPAGEAAKELGVAEAGWRAAAEAKLTRSDAIIGIGGGSVTDLAGFVAATWLRGIAVVHVPTTLLAMVDAAVGGKSGINTEAGKNLVGSFHPPAAVLCDLELLATLPAPEMRSGLAEVAKCGFIADPQILQLLAQLPAGEPEHGLAAAPGLLQELVVRAVDVKAKVVTADLREAGPREALNFGHTLGHAIERAEHYTWRHGEAISIGMVFAAALAAAAGRAPAGLTGQIRSVLSRLGLPVTYPGGDFGELAGTMRLDKKARGSHLRFVIVPQPGSAEILTDPPEAALRAAAREIGLTA